MVFDLFICFTFPIILINIIYKPPGQTPPSDLKVIISWLVVTIVAIIIYYLGNSLLRYTIGWREITSRQLHRLNAIMIYGYIGLFLLTMFLSSKP